MSQDNTVKVEITGLSEVMAAMTAIGADVTRALGQAVEATALESMSDARKAIQHGPKTGREYRRGKKVHRASAPGQAPATDTGALVSSIYYTKVSDLEAVIGSRLDYAYFLEFGTRKMAARPAWIPAVVKNIPRLEKRVEKIIRDAKARAEKGTA